MTDRDPSASDASADPYNGELANDADLGDGAVADDKDDDSDAASGDN